MQKFIISVKEKTLVVMLFRLISLILSMVWKLF